MFLSRKAISFFSSMDGEESILRGEKMVFLPRRGEVFFFKGEDKFFFYICKGEESFFLYSGEERFFFWVRRGEFFFLS